MPKHTEKTRPYSIQITDVTTRRDVILTTLDLTADELRVVVDQVTRLTGAPARNRFADLVAPKSKRRKS